MAETDVLIIGAGPGGYVAAIKLGKLGKKALIVDKDKLGGECLNYGCIPSKALISAANLVHKIRHAGDIGINVPPPTIDMAKLQQWKSNLIQGFNRGIGSLLKGNTVDVMSGEAKFTGPHSAQVTTASGTETISFQHAMIATGSQPIDIPGFKIDGQNILSSKDALELTAVPASLLVIGGGVIGLEIGTVYAKLGAKVTVVEMMDQLLPGIDPELTRPVSRSLQKLGVDIFLSSRATAYAAGPSGLEVSITTPDGDKKLAVEKILLSVGRRPNSDGLGLEAAGVNKDAKGFITVNDRLQTNVPHIYAIGDLIGAPLLAHKASHEGIKAAYAIAGHEAEPLGAAGEVVLPAGGAERIFPLGAVPWAIFTDPEVAFVGITETQAKEQGLDPAVGRFPFSASGRAQTTREPDGFVKVISEKGSGKILGVGIVGPEASDLISEASLALRMKATVDDIAATIHPHPTLPEALQEAAEASVGQAIHIMAAVRR